MIRLVSIFFITLFLIPLQSHAAIFIDNAGSGCTNGLTNYDPATSTCGAGSDTVYTTWSNAVAGVSAGSQGNPTVINVRSGTDYTDTVDITKAWTTWQKYSGDSEKPILNGNWTVEHKWSGFIDIRATGVTIDGIEIKNTGHYPDDQPGTNDAIGQGIDVTNYSYAVIKNCYIHHIGGMGVRGSGAEYLTIENNELYECHYGKLEGTRATWGSAIMASFSSDHLTITGNTVHGIGGEGLNLNRNGNDILIEDNVVYDTLFPAIFINGMQNVICRDNLVYHTGTARYLGYSAGIIVAAEWWYVPSHYYSDSDGVDVYHNMVAGTVKPLGIAEVTTDYGYQVKNTRFYNNTIIEPAATYQSFYAKGSGAVGTGVVVKNNIFWQTISTAAITNINTSAITFANNLWLKAPQSVAQSSSDPGYPTYGLLTISNYFSKGSGWGSIASGSLTASDFDLLLTATMAIDQGTNDAWYIANITTYYGSAPDCGAYEYGYVLTELSPTTQQSCGSDPQTVNLSFTSPVNMYCRESTNAAHTAYTDMSNQINNGENTTSHNEDFSQACGGSTLHYVICNTASDGSGVESNRAEITIDVESEGGYTAPPGSAIRDANGISISRQGGLSITRAN